MHGHELAATVRECLEVVSTELDESPDTRSIGAEARQAAATVERGEAPEGAVIRPTRPSMPTLDDSSDDAAWQDIVDALAKLERSGPRSTPADVPVQH